MSNSRHLRRKMTGKSGRSPAKSQRRARKRQRFAWELQRARESMLEATKPLIDGVAESLVKRDDGPADDPTEDTED